MAIPLPPPPLRSALKHSNSPSAATSLAFPLPESFSPPLPSSTSSCPSTTSTSYSPIATTSERGPTSSASITSGTTGTTVQNNPLLAYAYASMPQTPVPGLILIFNVAAPRIPSDHILSANNEPAHHSALPERSYF
ncbi:hypothetical protein K435DRAFT_877815 [Dendrothele bispora CBS 962.96]|uniref:Uncharacterized protein n=1 Tax=Dendrothele bispora (strain CBS 962.96) TaxID=1314807 RepID=A0A4S8KP41_DENBC|nr:hypothetical protein K435DRAFT_877815 [Dendrothele bispora CBS 962.96]